MTVKLWVLIDCIYVLIIILNHIHISFLFKMLFMSLFFIYETCIQVFIKLESSTLTSILLVH